VKQILNAVDGIVKNFKWIERPNQGNTRWEDFGARHGELMEKLKNMLKDKKLNTA
jgi:hypothetical protein